MRLPFLSMHYALLLLQGAAVRSFDICISLTHVVEVGALLNDHLVGNILQEANLPQLLL